MKPGQPRFATSRRSNRRTYGGDMAEYARRVLGVDVMPWQAQVADAALEVRADGSYFYDTVVVTVPRQSGKTTMVQALAGWRAERSPGTHIAYTAQSRKDAADRVFEFGDSLPVRESTRTPDHLGPGGLFGEFVGGPETNGGSMTVRVYRAAGSERVQWANGSRLSVVAPNAKGGHGGRYPLVILDESWTIEQHVLQALTPSQATFKDRQLWVVSTAGTHDSLVLDMFRKLGREQLGQAKANVAYFEWGIDGTDLDPFDESTWEATHPALGHTIDISAIRSAAQTLPPEEFIRAYTNKTVSSSVAVIATDWWEHTTDRNAMPAVGDRTLTLAVDMSAGPESGAISAAFIRPDGTPHMTQVTYRAGSVTNELPGRLAELITLYKPAAIAIDAKGPAQSIVPEVERLAEMTGTPLWKLNAREVGGACGIVYDRLRAGTLSHGHDEELNAAVAGARKATYGDLWYWARKRSINDVSPLVAATLALYVTLQLEKDPPPEIVIL